VKPEDMDMESITVSQSFQTDKSKAEKFTKTEIESNLEIGFWSGKALTVKG